MTIFSHRGNLNGPRPSNENSPGYIDMAIKAGFAVEIDMRVQKDLLFLGHDAPEHEVSVSWVSDRRKSLLIHLKNAVSLIDQSGLWGLHWFYHFCDPFVNTSWGYIWLHDTKIEANEHCIVPLIGKRAISSFSMTRKIFGVCTDFPYLASKKFQ